MLIFPLNIDKRNSGCRRLVVDLYRRGRRFDTHLALATSRSSRGHTPPGASGGDGAL